MRRWLALLAALTGCRISYLPPASSRSDGGPVVTRGVITHEARSQVRLYRDAAGCESVQTVNHQFRVVTVTTEAGRQRLVLEEAYDVRLCLDGGGSSSEATITAWLPDSGSAPPRFRITGRGVSGMPVGNLYRLQATGCCGSGTLGTYYSLITGQLLFSSSLPPIELEVDDTGRTRFIAFHDTFSGTPPPEATDSTVIGVLQIGDDRQPARRLVLAADRKDAYAIEQLRFVRKGRVAADSTTGVPIAVELGFRATGSGRRFAVRVPIAADSLEPARATLPTGVSWRR
jgi:hypothetical protein